MNTTDTKEVTDYIFLDDINPTGDIAFVFGTWNVWRESAEKAAELYKKGFVPKIIISGGKIKNGTTEGDNIAKELEKLGVNYKDILIENKSVNTLENVLFSKEIIERELGFKNIKTIVAVVKNYHARRALMTLRRHIPSNIQLKAAAYTTAYYPFTKENWDMVEKGKKIVMEEVEKIKEYLAKGDLAEL